MSDILKSLNEYLVADATILASTSTRVYQMRAPTKPTAPYAVMQRISERHGTHLLAGDGRATARIQISIFAATRSALQTAAEAFRGAIHGYRGAVGSANLPVLTMHIEGPSDYFDESDMEPERGLFVSRFDVLVWYTESVPTF